MKFIPSKEKQDEDEIAGDHAEKIDIPEFQRVFRDFVRGEEDSLIGPIDHQPQANRRSRDPNDEPNQQSDVIAFVHPDFVVGPEVLPHEGEHRGPKTAHRRHHQVEHLACCSIAELGGHAYEHRPVRGAVEADDRGLHDDDPDFQDRELQSHGQAVLQVAEDEGKRNLPIGFSDSHPWVADRGVNHGSESRKGLGDDGSPCASGDAPMEDDDEQQIEPDVQKRGDDEKEEWGERVPIGTENAEDHIEESGGEGANVKHGDVGLRRFVFRLHRSAARSAFQSNPVQKGVDQRQGDQSQDHRGDRGQNDLGQIAFPRPRFVSGPESLRGHNRISAGGANRELHDDPNRWGGAVDASHFRLTEVLSNDDRIG